jgi:hypothetical protein
MRVGERAMEWGLEQGERVRYRVVGTDGDEYGLVRKAMHVLSAGMDLVPVYVVDTDAGEVVILGDGEIIEVVSGRV